MPAGKRYSNRFLILRAPEQDEPLPEGISLRYLYRPGGDLNPEAGEVAERRLVEQAGLPPGGWLVERDTFASYPFFSSGQAPLLTYVGQVEELQKQVGVLLSQFHEIQATLAGGDPDEIIDTLEARIQSFLADWQHVHNNI